MKHDILYASLAAALAGTLLLPVTMPKSGIRDAYPTVRRYVTLSERITAVAPSIIDFRDIVIGDRY